MEEQIVYSFDFETWFNIFELSIVFIIAGLLTVNANDKIRKFLGADYAKYIGFVFIYSLLTYIIVTIDFKFDYDVNVEQYRMAIISVFFALILLCMFLYRKKLFNKNKI